MTALLGLGGYLAYQSFFPAQKKKGKKLSKSKAITAVGPDPTPVATPGSGIYHEEWIPEGHIKKPRGKKEGVLSSGDEKSGVDSAGETRRRSSRRNKA